MFGLGINKLGASRSQAIAEPETLLFANDEEGTFLDFTSSQVYANTAGTTPAAVGTGIALTLDKSQGANDVRRNLLTYTEEFDNAAWVKSNATVTANAAVAPDGTTTAELLIPNVVSAAHFATNLTPVGTAAAHTLTFYCKASGYSKVGLREQTSTGSEAVFVLSGAGSVLTTTGGTVTASIEALANDWYRIRMTLTFAGAAQFRVYPLDDAYTSGNLNSYSWTGDGTSGIYIWGAQLELGSTATEYQKITSGINGEWTPGVHALQSTSTARPIFGRVPVSGRRNLLERTEEFDNEAWTFRDYNNAVLASVVTPNVEIAPDGTLSVDKLDFTPAGSSLTRGQRFTAAPNTTYYYSIWVRRERIDLFGEYRVSVSTGLAGARVAAGVLQINIPVSDDLQKLEGSFTTGAASIDSAELLVSKAGTSATGYVYVWGASIATEAGPYQRVVTQHDITEAGVPSIYKAFFDKSDDILPVTLPTITGGTVALVGTSGIWIEDDWDFTAGTLNIGPTTIAGLPAGILSVVGDLCAVIINDRAWSAAERAGVIAWGKARAGDVAVYSQVATFNWDSGATDPAATYDKALPVPVQQQIYDQIRGCTLNTDGTVNYYLKATDWAFKADDTASDLTGADGNVMVEIPKFYYRTRFTGTQTTWEISPVPLTGFQVHPAFILDGVEVSKRYYGAYDACVYDDSASAYISGLNLDNNAANIDTAADKLASVKGVYPMVGVTRPECRLLAANNGTGWRQLDFYLWSAVGMLYAVEYQTFYNQDELGNGNTNNSYLASSADQDDSPHTIAGYRDDVGNGSTTSANGQGTATKPGTVAMKYRGIENLFGNCWNWTDAININVGATGNVHLATDNNRANYADDTTTNYTLVTDSLTTASNNIQAFLPLGPYFLASAVGGTTAQYVTDRHYGSASANRVALVGGSASDGGLAGVFALGAVYVAGTRNRSIGTRLAR